jgi:hypothetical protein
LKKNGKRFGIKRKFIKLLKKKKNTPSDSQEYFIIKNNKVITISQEQKEKLINNVEYYEALVGGSPLNEDPNNPLRILLTDNNSTRRKEIYEGVYTVSPIYTDWSLVNANPDNMFRDFNSSLLHPDQSSYFTGSVFDNIKNKEPEIFLQNLLNQSERNDKKPSGELVKGPSYHPTEYTTFDLIQTINAYNTIMFFKLDEYDFSYFEEDYKQAKNIYKQIIDNNIQHLDTTNKNKVTYYTFKKGIDQEIKNTQYGHPITSYSLNNAIHYGALFIRKVLHSSRIDEYTNQLFNLRYYRPGGSGITRDIKYSNNDSIIFKKGQTSGYYEKYIKYKTKYIQLKSLM